MVERPAVNR